jgi:hypothetical protein
MTQFAENDDVATNTLLEIDLKELVHTKSGQQLLALSGKCSWNFPRLILSICTDVVFDRAENDLDLLPQKSSEDSTRFNQNGFEKYVASCCFV